MIHSTQQLSGSALIESVQRPWRSIPDLGKFFAIMRWSCWSASGDLPQLQLWSEMASDRCHIHSYPSRNAPKVGAIETSRANVAEAAILIPLLLSPPR